MDNQTDIVEMIEIHDLYDVIEKNDRKIMLLKLAINACCPLLAVLMVMPVLRIFEL